MGSQGTVWLLSSAGRRVELLKLLRETSGGQEPSVVAVDSSADVPTRISSDFFRQIPRIDNPRFLASVIKICQEFSVDYVIPTIDTELSIYSGSRELLLEAGTDVLVSLPTVVDLAGDKLAFANWLGKNGFPHIPTWPLDRDQLISEEGPFFIKPRFGSASVGARRVDRLEEIIGHSFQDEMVTQPYLDGAEFTIDFAVAQGGTLAGISVRERLKVRAGEVVCAATRDRPDLEALVFDLVARLPGLYGVLNLQLIETPTQALILELNARVGGGFPLSAAAGCNLFETFLEGHSAGLRRPKFDIQMLRYDASYFVPQT